MWNEGRLRGRQGEVRKEIDSRYMSRGGRVETGFAIFKDTFLAATALLLSTVPCKKEIKKKENCLEHVTRIISTRKTKACLSFKSSAQRQRR